MILTIEELRELLTQTPVARTAMQADAQRLACALEGEPEVDQHDNFAGAAAAVIERLRHEIADAWIERDKAKADGVHMDEGARRNMADALGRPGLMTWVGIEGAARAMVAERILEQSGVAPLDALPVLSIGGANANGCNVLYRAPEAARFAPGDEVLVGQWRYRVVERWIVGGGADTWGVRIQPLDGAPVQPTGDGLMIARAKPRAEDDECKAEADAQIERLLEATRQKERARHEQRRLDLAEKLGNAALGWEAITEEVDALATFVGWRHSSALKARVTQAKMLDEHVFRFALAMQERLATFGMHSWSGQTREQLLDGIHSAASGLSRDLLPMTIRWDAARMALIAMVLAQKEGDLERFDAQAEIAAALGKSA